MTATRSKCCSAYTFAFYKRANGNRWAEACRTDPVAKHTRHEEPIADSNDLFGTTVQ
jgi:hypothetical protein